MFNGNSSKLQAFIRSHWPKEGQWALPQPQAGDKKIVYRHFSSGEIIEVPLPEGDRVVTPPQVRWASAEGGYGYPSLPEEYARDYTEPYLVWQIGLLSELTPEFQRIRDELNALLGE